MPAKVHKLGPGLLTIGDAGSEVDFSCQVTAAHVDWTADVSDEVTVLCGEVVPGARTYTAVMAGTILQDLTTGAIVDYSWDHKGEQVPFTFQPTNPAAAGTPSVGGTLILDPLTVGGDEAGENMTSDFEWAIVGTPTFTPASAAVMAAQAAVGFGEHAGGKAGKEAKAAAAAA